MGEFMPTNEIDARVLVIEQPIKGEAASFDITFEQLQAQADINRRNMIPVDYTAVYGTCPDERPHGKEPRPAVFGGPVVYALAIAELCGLYKDSPLSSTQRLTDIKQKLNDNGIKGGGHGHCAANAGFINWMGSIYKTPQAVAPYVKQELDSDYDETIMTDIQQNARTSDLSAVYEDWSEDVLVNVTGPIESPDAIESVGDVPHEGVTFGKNMIKGMTIDQTSVYEQSIIGKGTFDFDVAYAETIEGIVTSGPDAVRLEKVARHAREAVIAAVAGAVPNPVLYQINITD